MYALNLRTQLAPQRRDDAIDWNAAIDKARAGVQSGNTLADQYEQLHAAITSFVADAKAQAAQLLQQLNNFRAAAEAQVAVYDDLDTIVSYEDDVPEELSQLFDDVSTGDYDSEIDDLESPLTDIIG